MPGKIVYPASSLFIDKNILNLAIIPLYMQSLHIISIKKDCPLDSPYIISLFSYAFPTEPKISIFSFTVALIASVPGANNLRGSKPLPC